MRNGTEQQSELYSSGLAAHAASGQSWGGGRGVFVQLCVLSLLLGLGLEGVQLYSLSTLGSYQQRLQDKFFLYDAHFKDGLFLSPYHFLPLRFLGWFHLLK